MRSPIVPDDGVVARAVEMCGITALDLFRIFYPQERREIINMMHNEWYRAHTIERAFASFCEHVTRVQADKMASVL